MDKKEAFKAFARLHPELISQTMNNNMTWQKFYEIYDIYGEDMNVWKDYIKPNNSSNIANDLTSKLKNVDMNSISEHIKTAQKALSLVSELTSKGQSAAVIPKVPRPVNQFFED